MWHNTKLLMAFAILVIAFGVGLISFGFMGSQQERTSASAGVTFEPVLIQQIVQTPTTTTIPEVVGVLGGKANVLEVVDGDTIKIDGGVTIRLIGIDTPETKDPRKPVQCFGKEASNMARDLLLGKQVILEKDVSETDKYRRLLRYIFLPLEDGSTLFVNDYLVREGFARVLTYPPDVKYNERLREAEREAKEENRGLWGRC